MLFFFFSVCEVFLLQRNTCCFSLSPTGGEEKNLKTSLVRGAGKLKISAPSDLPVVEESHFCAFTYCLLLYLP